MINIDAEEFLNLMGWDYDSILSVPDFGPYTRSEIQRWGRESGYNVRFEIEA